MIDFFVPNQSFTTKHVKNYTNFQFFISKFFKFQVFSGFVATLYILRYLIKSGY